MSHKRPWPVWPLILIFAFLALMAIPVGFIMMTQPHSDAIGMPYAWIQATFLRSWLIPGILLFGLLGLGSLCAIYALLALPGWAWAERLNFVPGLRWEWTFVTGLGLAFMVWITVQVLTLRMYFWLQPVVFGLGALVVLLMLLPSMRRYFARPRASAVTPASAAAR